MRTIQATFTFRVTDDATDDDIARMIDYAAVQIEEPVDEEGDRAAFETEGLHADWFVATVV